MNTLKSTTRTPYAEGVVKFKTSVLPESSTSESVDLLEASDKQYLIMARIQSNQHAMLIYINKNITLGDHPIGRDEEVFAYYYHSEDGSGWNYYADSGTLTLNSVDFDKPQVDAKFKFEAPGKEEGAPTMKVTNGTIKLTGPSK